MVIEINIEINPFVGFFERSWLVPIDALHFEDREEIFRHSVVIAVSSS